MLYKRYINNDADSITEYLMVYDKQKDEMKLNKYQYQMNNISDIKELEQPSNNNKWNFNSLYTLLKQTKDLLMSYNLLKGLEILLSGLEDSKTDTYLSIVKEELEYKLKNKLGCPDEKLDILLINLIPFINYKFNLSSKFLLSLEIKYLIKKLLRKKHENNLDLKKNLLNEVWKSYINNKLHKEDYIGIITNQWISKINL